jgi:PBP1b-binding outer membrane lipoprotein LpoB
MTHLQKTLSAMQIDKERIENEYRKLGTSKNKTQIQRKQELEFDIEVLNKNIHSIKQKLRELHAF